MNKKYTVYDLEVLKNLFTATFKDWKTKQEKVFIIGPGQNDLIPLMKFLRAIYRHNYTLVGFNCNAYDNQILEYIIAAYYRLKPLDGVQVAEAIHNKSQWIFSLPQDERWKQLIPEWKFHIPHIDIFRQKHYDGKGKMCSLKWLEFTMRFENIESMPIAHSTLITSQKQVDDVVRYNINDVRATYRSFEINQFETDLRIKLSEKYDLNLLNASEPRLARDIFGRYLSDQMGVEYRELKERRTYRSNLRGDELVFPYVKYRDPVLKAVKQFFLDLEFNPYNFEQNNMGLKEVNKTFKFHTIPEVTVGLGGIHGCTKPGVYESTDTWWITDVDVESYYPNIGIKNGLFPEHLSTTFCVVTEDLFNLRKTIPKEDPVNYVLKIILNSAYGLSKEPNNYFHDPKYTFTITINGQLMLLMLAEIFRAKIPGVVFYQFNTDGMSIGHDKKYMPQVEECMAIWEKFTRLKLEKKQYTKMVIKDVNNYMAQDTKGKIKRKGKFFAYSLDPEDKELDYHKNPSQLIIPKALEAHFFKGVPVEKTIKGCNDIYDFCLGVKVKRDFNLMCTTYNKEKSRFDKTIINEQVVRFYISTEPMSLKKHYKQGTKKAGQTVEIIKGWQMTYFNVFEKKPMKDYKINYKYYIKKCNEVIQEIAPHATNLKMF